MLTFRDEYIPGIVILYAKIKMYVKHIYFIYDMINTRYIYFLRIIKIKYINAHNIFYVPIIFTNRKNRMHI